MRTTIFFVMMSITAVAQPPKPREVSDYNRGAIIVTWRTSKQPQLNAYIRRNVSVLAVEDEKLNELAKKALFRYLMEDYKAHSNVVHSKSPKYYIPDSLRFELNTLPAVDNYYKASLHTLEDYKLLHHTVSSTSLMYQGYYVERYGSVWFDVYDPEEGHDKGVFLIIVKLWYDDGFKVWTQNADLDF